MKRRDFLKYMLASTASGAWLTHSNLAQAANNSFAPKALVIIFQRGGCDGLNVTIPYGDTAYYNLRPTIAVAPPGAVNAEGVNVGALDMNGFHGLHPAMSSLHNLYTQGKVAAFPAVHYTNASRSHFDSQFYIENAEVNRHASTGWLNKHLAGTSNSTGMRGVSFSNSRSQALTGSAPVSSFTDLRNFDLNMEATAEGRLINRISRIYNQTSASNRPYRNLLKSSGRTLFTDLDIVSRIDASGYTASNGAVYPDNAYGRQLAQTAQLIKEGAGVEIATINRGGWDTHRDQGGADGRMANNLRSFSEGIAAFYQDMGDTRMNNVMVLTMTEFGRTAKENGSFGTDHGHASSWFALGGGLTGGVYGQWPGLQAAQLERGRYLAQATDFRDIFNEIMIRHLGNADSDIIPNYTANNIGFLAGV